MYTKWQYITYFQGCTVHGFSHLLLLSVHLVGVIPLTRLMDSQNCITFIGTILMICMTGIANMTCVTCMTCVRPCQKPYLCNDDQGRNLLRDIFNRGTTTRRSLTGLPLALFRFLQSSLNNSRDMFWCTL
jgi:hypothetical protein